MTLNLHALVRDFGIIYSGISLHWKQCGILPCYTLVDDINQRLHPTLHSIIIAVYNECTPYLSPSYRRHTPHTLSSLLRREKVCRKMALFNVRLYGSKRLRFGFMNNPSQVQFGPALVS